MIILVTGGAASGKSEYAEKRLLDLSRGGRSAGYERYYLATMIPRDDESCSRVDKHIRRRAGMEYTTYEYSYDIRRATDKLLKGNGRKCLLLEDCPNLVAGEMFSQDGTINCNVGRRITDDIMSLSKVCECILIVTGEVSSDGKRYDEWTEAFIRELGVLNRCLANVADEVIEVVYGIPITIRS